VIEVHSNAFCSRRDRLILLAMWNSITVGTPHYSRLDFDCYNFEVMTPLFPTLNAIDSDALLSLMLLLRFAQRFE
jgi:hypothetical protein